MTSVKAWDFSPQVWMRRCFRSAKGVVATTAATVALTTAALAASEPASQPDMAMVFERAVLAIESVTDATAEHVSPRMCAQSGHCLANVGVVFVLAQPVADQAYLKLSPASERVPQLYIEACAAILAEFADIDMLSAQDLVALSGRMPLLEGPVFVARMQTPMGPSCRLRISSQ